MKRWAIAILLGGCVSAVASHRHAPAVERSPAQCAWDGKAVELPYMGDATLTTMKDVVVRGGYDSVTDSSAVHLTFARGEELLMKLKINDMSNPNGFAAQSADRRWLSLDSSNGGATGGWSVSIFQLAEDGKIVDLSSSMNSVIHDFSSRHSCPTRGDNYRALQWRDDDALLVTAEVYPTGDCGKQGGYTEGYVLQPSTGKILHRYTASQLLHLPAVCIWNTDTRR